VIKTQGPKGLADHVFGGSGADAKGSHRQVLPHLSAKTTITPGDPMSRMANQYGKGHSFGVPGDMSGMTGQMASAPLGAAGQEPPANHPGLTMVRGGSGGMKRNPRSGGLGADRETYPKGTGQ
jgi:hypothetical protein